MKQIILGTAGHIDHGKTSLIKALTGIDTDRLKEEKLRGITIELGFAWLDLPGNRRIGVVDVPGHEKFVKNMVAGAAGIDIVTMIIAADEGVMPQTREHLDICNVLGIKYGLVALTKKDMVDEEWLELVKDDVEQFLEGTFLEGAPILPVSSSTGEGIPEFIEELEALCESVPDQTEGSLFRLPVDRVFSMKGFGTVITGSLVSGRVQVGETVMIYPSGIQVKVRGIQFHGEKVDQASAGMRTAINFQALDKTTISRGDVISGVGLLKPSFMVDTLLEYLPGNEKPLKNRTKVRFHTGASEVLGYAILLDREELSPGDKAPVQFRLDVPLAIVKDDRFVIRSYSPVRTIGGGQVLNPIPPKHKRFRDEIIAGFKLLAEGAPADIIEHHLEAGELLGLRFSDLHLMTNLSDKELENHLQQLLSKRAIIQIDKELRLFVHGNTLEKLRRKAVGTLEAYHQKHPLKDGMARQELMTRLAPSLNNKLFTLLIQDLSKTDTVVQEKEIVRLSSHTVALGADEQDMRRSIEQAYLDSGLEPPYFRDMVSSLGQNPAHAKEILMHMLKDGTLVKVKEDLFFHGKIVEDLKDKLVSVLKAGGEITTPEFKEMTGVSRKYTIPLIEFFDTSKVTIRIGDIRRLREG